MRHWHYRAFLLDFEGSQPQRKAKRAGSYQSRKNSQCLTSASTVQYGKALELIAGYRSFPPVGPSLDAGGMPLGMLQRVAYCVRIRRHQKRPRAECGPEAARICTQCGLNCGVVV